MNGGTVHNRWFLTGTILVGLLLAWPCSSHGADAASGLLVRFTSDWQPVVEELEASRDRVELGDQQVGLVVWTGPAGDRWEVFRGNWKRPPEASIPVWVTESVRSPGTEGQVSAAAFHQLTTQLDPLFLPSVIKSLASAQPGTLLTPPDGGASLSARPTFRRFVEEGASLPPAVAVLSDGEHQARLLFPASRDTLPWEQISGLPEAWATGLPAGRYQVRWREAGGPASSFLVEEQAARDHFDRQLHPWKDILGGTADGLYTLIAVELLIAGQPRPYLGDVLDWIDHLPAEQLTTHLRWRRAAVVAALRSHPEPASPELAEDLTAVPGVDQARQYLLRGRWDEAFKSLQQIPQATGPLQTADGVRGEALADLYRGVLHAEAGLGQEEAAEFYFRKALGRSDNLPAGDRLRVLNNFANFLLDRTQDRMLDHAFQLAAGVRGLFVTAIGSWEDARRLYEAAGEVAARQDVESRAVVQLNQARLEAILADLLATLDDPREPDGAGWLEPAIRAAGRRAEAKLAQALEHLPAESLHLRAAALTLRAQLAARSADFPSALRDARQARALHVQRGSLPGVESVERLLGFVTLREGSAASESDGQAARRHFMTAQRLAELLRERLPPERIGRTAAGFFARRSSVYEQLVEISLREGRPREALEYAEQAKARALENLLLREPGASSDVNDFPLRQLLDHWPRDVAALEYFFTQRQAWVFYINPSGEVRAHLLRDESGEPIAARALVGRVRSILHSEFNQYGSVLRQRMLAGSGFDHQWQHRLHELYRILFPEPLRDELDGCRTLLIVPHHVLHYFPFVALVREPDPRERGKLEMVQPRFVLDAPYAVCYAPSLGVWQRLRSGRESRLEQVAAAVVPELPGAAPLPGVARELRYLAESFPSRLKRAVVAEQATRASTRDLLQQSGMLLIGTHGQNYPDQPLASELFLHPSPGDSGRLTAAELYGCRVESELVVLSACYTALADRSPLPGDDLFGLSRALLQSGSKTVVTGYWDVFEGTGPELMRGFFARLSAGVPVPAALADAQRQFVNGLRQSAEPEPWLHPYFWAVFGSSGDDRTCFAKPGPERPGTG